MVANFLCHQYCLLYKYYSCFTNSQYQLLQQSKNIYTKWCQFLWIFSLLINISPSRTVGNSFYLLKSGPNYYFLTKLWLLDLIFFLELLSGLFYQTLIFNIFKTSSQGLKPLSNIFIGYSFIIILNYLVIITKILFLHTIPVL